MILVQMGVFLLIYSVGKNVKQKPTNKNTNKKRFQLAHGYVNWKFRNALSPDLTASKESNTKLG